ncbi:MAG: transposase, partial [Gemmatimonadaceae bacterium]
MRARSNEPAKYLLHQRHVEHWFVQGHDFRLSQQPGIHVKTVATALEIHPFMLSKWRKDARDGRLRGRAPKAPPPGPAREIAQLQALEAMYAALQEEHELLKKGSPGNFGNSGDREELMVHAMAPGGSHGRGPVGGAVDVARGMGRLRAGAGDR